MGVGTNVVSATRQFANWAVPSPCLRQRRKDQRQHARWLVQHFHRVAVAVVVEQRIAVLGQQRRRGSRWTAPKIERELEQLLATSLDCVLVPCLYGGERAIQLEV